MKAAQTKRNSRAGLESLALEDTFVRELPADPLLVNVPRQVADACYTRVDPTPVTAPRLLGWSFPLGEVLGIQRPSAIDVLAGNRVLPGMKPYAARYGGHQFGTWAGQLGDGRAITLAEIIAADGSRQELQLKGAGRTPYSRTADGRAVLRSSLREFVCSEAMHFLGVPTTRALSLAGTGEQVIRDMFYDGNPAPEPGAIVCRVAPSFVRFGNFQIHAANGEIDSLKRLAGYVMRMHYPGLDSVEKFFQEVCRRTALLLVDWMRLGFVHGVMNTDNMSILGLTIDYGPYGWLEPYDPQWTPNTTDEHTRRYCYGNQPHIAQWNLARLAEALLPLVPDQAPLEEGLALYADTFNREWRRALAHKLGLAALDQPGDEQLVADLFTLLYEVETDFTLFFRNLASLQVDDAFYAKAPGGMDGWLRRYSERAKSEQDRVERMNRANPKYVFRNYLAQLAIDALERGDASVLERLMKVLERPYDEQPGQEDLAARRPEWARRRAGCSALSCSS
ncbi:MAG TPA: YdiU family protein [Burkholderiales bacterium]|nr:YdiU family protein [Burkholderiales bacterium]